MIRKVITNLIALSVICSAMVACEGLFTPPVSEEDLYNAAGNESFVENPLVNTNATRIWTTPETPDADAPDRKSVV